MSHPDTKSANEFLAGVCGIDTFFENEAELVALKLILQEDLQAEGTVDRREFGDYQTNATLAEASVELASGRQKFDLLLEPTCGKGSFIVAALDRIPTLSRIVGIEIYRPYVWETKHSILSYYLDNPDRPVIEINILHRDVFQYDFETLAQQTKNLRTLIVGNPPWVTNAELSTLNSQNLPKKHNSNKQKGLDALTGKSNFDLGEAVMQRLFDSFDQHTGRFGLLVKNTVVKNLVKRQFAHPARIGKLRKYVIDAKKEFDVSVNAALFTGTLGRKTVHKCAEYDFYTRAKISSFGWVDGKFVSSIRKYKRTSHVDGVSPFVWRSGMKHDCTKIMELDKVSEGYRNKLGQIVDFEEDLVFGLLKSSDLKQETVDSSRKFTVVTQRKIGQDTSYIQSNCPLLYAYLSDHEKLFAARKSSIYKGKPKFSIFGIGDYSFKPHKVAISGLYKTTRFTYVGPADGKPLMLDDTCYFIGFDHSGEAKIAQFLLNSPTVQDFLSSIIFADSKRSITKDILMRVDLEKVCGMYNLQDVHRHDDSITFQQWENFKQRLVPECESQPTLF